MIHSNGKHGLLGFCQQMANKKKHEHSVEQFSKATEYTEKAHKDLIAPSLPYPPCNTTGLAVVHTHVRGPVFRRLISISLPHPSPSFPFPPLHATLL